jgi:hypothetical protein
MQRCVGASVAVRSGAIVVQGEAVLRGAGMVLADGC